MKVKFPLANYKFFALAALVILLISGAFYIGRLTMEVELLREGGSAVQGEANDAAAPSAPAKPESVSIDNLEPISDSDHVRGDRNAKIALIEYSDYECPFCQRFHSTAQQVVDNYAGDVMWVYRHFPLDSIHSRATPAAIAAECVASAGGNDAFWSYTDTLFSGGDLSQTSLIQQASDLGFDITTCLQNEETADAVAEDFTYGQKAGITGTPGNILLNTETNETVLVPGALPYTQLSEAIDGLL